MDWAPSAPEGMDGPTLYVESGWDNDGEIVGLLFLNATGWFLFPEGSSALVNSLFSVDPTPLLKLTDGNSNIGLTALVATFTLLVLHEGTHYIGGMMLGYNPRAPFVSRLLSLNRRALNIYVVIKREFIKRRHRIALLLLPLVILNTTALIGLLAMDSYSTLDFLFRFVFVVNSALSGQDIVDAIHLRKFDSGTLFWNLEADDGLKSVFYTPE